MAASNWQQILRDELSRLDDSHLRRTRHVYEPVDATHVRAGERVFVNFASNNYLGLTHHAEVQSAARASIADSGAGAGAAGLITGFSPAHFSAEQSIARWKQAERAVLLPSGYQANLAAIQTIAGVATAASRPLRFLVDKLAHASLWDAVRVSGMPFRIFPHNHLGKLERLLHEADANALQVVVTESIFSMDGDAADLRGLAELKARYPFLLFVDEAHATGVYGASGAGLVAELGLTASVDVSVMTLSKALGISGGAVCGSATFCDALLNFGRAFIFSTAIPPHLAAAAEAAVSVIQREPHRQLRLRVLAARLRSALYGSTTSDAIAGQSPIVPIILGEESAALAAAEELRAAGLLVVAVRPPSVPRGSSRLRITLCCEHTDEDVDRLITGVQSIMR